jgi:hypothetical protein
MRILDANRRIIVASISLKMIYLCRSPPDTILEALHCGVEASLLQDSATINVCSNSTLLDSTHQITTATAIKGSRRETLIIVFY